MTFTRATSWDLARAAVVGGVTLALGVLTVDEPLGRALWAVVAAVLLLPLSWRPVAQAFLPVSAEGRTPSRRDHGQERLCHWTYAAACAPLMIGTLLVAGVRPAVVVAAVAGSLAGGATLLALVRVRADLAVAVTMLGAMIAFTWPIWAAGLLATHDFGAWRQRLIDVSPAFALNAAIAPDDPLTHRPRAYRLMNLGQDVSYAMPASVWPCVILHAAIGVVGMMGGWMRRDAGGDRCHPEERSDEGPTPDRRPT